MPQLPSIGQAELEILQYIHDRQPATVRQVSDHLAETRGVTRTTVINVVSRLCDKGYLTRRKIAGVYQYVPRIPKGKLLTGLVRDFVKGSLGGSVSPFMLYLANEADVTDNDLAELKKLVTQLESKAGRKSK